MTLTFWFDVHSPWAYLAAHRIGALARKHEQPLMWRPLHLPRLMDAIGGFKPLEAAPQRVAWFRQDISIMPNCRVCRFAIILLIHCAMCGRCAPVSMPPTRAGAKPLPAACCAPTGRKRETSKISTCWPLGRGERA